jgi:hypothetical protein
MGARCLNSVIHCVSIDKRSYSFFLKKISKTTKGSKALWMKGKRKMNKSGMQSRKMQIQK